MDPDSPSPGSRDGSPPDSTLFDDSRWPLLVLRLPGNLSTPEHLACLDAFAAYLQRGERFVMLVDLSRVGMVPLDQRWRQVEWFEKHERALLKCVQGTAVLLTSPLVQLSLSAILHFIRFYPPLATFADLAGAEAWAARRMHEVGLTQLQDPR
ncbi:hypothetical protein [Cystobacter ferrugineus]|uniref:STAS/SEC14 domain-containing protein n=1 Tax=Cystobacter ferrugineus TaxID=83449 RepID=A0A1L9BIQ7_9BACT|nr:hypothetical protein [Cystobacter ferrugineus]OJH42119.1 hypothetical protein BON30_02555 [Cystobacter ferrugineus]